MTPTTAPHRQRTALVTGANGFIGHSVARTFARAGYKTYGLARRESSLQALAANEVIPVLGSPGDLKFLPKLLKETPAFDVIVSTTEQISNYVEHYDEIINMLRTIATAGNDGNTTGIRPLVLFTSGCKDYGRGTLVDDPGLAPHTESSPIRPEPWAEGRATNAVRIFEHADLFDAVIFRPVTLYGYDGSYYGGYLQRASAAATGAGGAKVLELPTDPRVVLHGMHVQDVAEAYLAAADPAHRDLVRGQCFNLSSWRYETAAEIAQSLINEYGLDGVRYVAAAPDDAWANVNARFTQWVGSDKIRNLLGWRDRKALFSEGVHVYRLAYEAAVADGHEGVSRQAAKFAKE